MSNESPPLQCLATRGGQTWQRNATENQN